MKNLNSEDIQKMPSRYRANLINSIGGYRSTVLVGTVSKVGYENLSIFSSLLHLGSSPPLFGLVFRPDVVARHTLTNIIETGYYTLNHVNLSNYLQGHQSSAKYPIEVSEFEACDLLAEYCDGFVAPYVAGSHVQLGMKLRQRIDLEINETIFIIGEVMEIRVSEDIIESDGFLPIDQLGSMTTSGLDCYYKVEKVQRLPYAKPE